MSVSERLQYGITERLPPCIEEALEALMGDYELFCNDMGKTMVDIFLAAKKADAKYMTLLDEEKRLQLVIKTY